MVHGLNQDELCALAKSLRWEAKKKLADEWRGDATANLLDSMPTAVAVEEALLHRDSHAQNTYRKIHLQRSQLLTLGSMLIVDLVYIGWTAPEFATADGVGSSAV